MSLSLYIIQAGRQLLAQGYGELEGVGTNLSQSDLLILLSIYELPGLTANLLAGRLGRDKTTLSRSINKLIENGLVRFAINSLDGRRREPTSLPWNVGQVRWPAIASDPWAM